MIGDEGIVAGMLSEEAVLEQLIEEAGELVQASAKRLRILRGENWTPISPEGNMEDIREELAGVSLLIDVYRAKTGIDITEHFRKKEQKCARWLSRLGVTK